MNSEMLESDVAEYARLGLNYIFIREWNLAEDPHDQEFKKRLLDQLFANGLRIE